MVSKTQIDRRKQRKTNPETVALVNFLKKQKAPLWNTLATLITRPRRKAIAVNIDKINKLTNGGEIAIVPGKILSKGELTHETAIIALRFSEQARKKLAKKANLMTMEEFIKKQKDFKNIPIKIIT